MCLGYLAAVADAIGILDWDAQTMMPPGAAAGRASQLAALRLVHHQILTDPALADAVERHNIDVHALPDPKSLAAFVIRARLFARASGLTDGVEQPSTEAPSSEWSVPPLSRSLAQTGGIAGIAERVAAFVEHAVARG